MSDRQIPRPVIAVVSDRLEKLYSHSTLDNLFDLVDAPNAGGSTLIKRISNVLKAANERVEPAPLDFLGTFLAEVFDKEKYVGQRAESDGHLNAIRDILRKHGLQYEPVGRIVSVDNPTAVPVATATLLTRPIPRPSAPSISPFAFPALPESFSSFAGGRSSEPSTTTSESSKPMSTSVKGSTPSIDVAIICALTMELDKVKAAGSMSWSMKPSEADDPQRYWQATTNTNRGSSLSMIGASPNIMGMTSSAVLATKMILRFRPRLVAMVGIAGGVAGAGVGFGDILLAEQTVDYGSGKISRRNGALHFSYAPNPIPIDTGILSHYRSRNNADECHEISKLWPGSRPPTSLAVRFGTYGTGNVVVDDKATIEDIAENWRKLVAVEMEVHAVHRACQDARRPATAFLAIKSASDLATKKDDTWREYAAFTAAQYCVRTLLADWEDLFPAKADG